MVRLGTISFALCSMMLWLLSGCFVVIPTIPLNAPGYGHTYQVLDQDDRPIKDGLLMLRSYYSWNVDMWRVYPIKDGRAKVPLKIATRRTGFCDLKPLRAFYLFENPYGTYVYPVSAGHIYKGGYEVYSRTNPDLLHGLWPPPKVLRMRKAPPGAARKDLDSIEGTSKLDMHSKEDRGAYNALKEYVEKHLNHSPP